MQGRRITKNKQRKGEEEENKKVDARVSPSVVEQATDARNEYAATGPGSTAQASPFAIRGSYALVCERLGW